MLPIIPDFEVGPRQFNLVDDEVGVHNCVPPADATSCVNRRDVFQDVPKTSFVPKDRQQHGQRREETKQGSEKVQKEVARRHEHN